MTADDIAKILRPSPTYRFVGAGGNDASDGLTWPTRKLTIAATVGLAAHGDTIVLGGSIFPERIQAAAKTLHFVGAGLEVNGTIVTGSGTGPTVALGVGSTMRDMKIAPAGADTIVMEGNHGVRLTRVHLVTATANAVAYNSLYNREVIEDSILDATYAISKDGGDLPLVNRCRITGLFVGDIRPFDSIVNGTPSSPSVPAPADPAKCNCFGTTIGSSGVAQADVECEFRLYKGPGTAGYLYERGSVTATSDIAGLLQIDLIKSSTYQVRRRGVGEWRNFDVGSGGTQAISEVLGRLGGD